MGGAASHGSSGKAMRPAASSDSDKHENGESKIEKFAQEAAELADKVKKMNLSDSKNPVVEDKENIKQATEAAEWTPLF